MFFKGIASNYSNLSGIYKIVNLINGKMYIGATMNIANRLFTHRKMLKKGVHSNKHLQNAYTKYGLTCFEFKIIKIIHIPEIVFKVEKRLIKKLNCVNNINYYNLTEGGLGGNTTTKELKSNIMKKLWADPNSTFNSNEYKEKRKKIFNNKEYRKILSDSQKEQWANPNSVFNSERYRNKLKNKTIFSDLDFQKENLKKIKKYWSKKENKEKHSLFMKKKWEDVNYKKEVSDKISIAKKNQWIKNKEKFVKSMNRKQVLVFNKDTKELLYLFNSRKECGEFFNYNPSHITEIIKGNRKPKKFSKYIIIYKNDINNYPELKKNKI